MECWLQEVLADEGLRPARQESVIVAARVIRKPGKALSRPSAGEANHQIGRVAYLSGGAYWTRRFPITRSCCKRWRAVSRMWSETSNSSGQTSNK
jgi:hypothetical protein